MMLVLQVIDGQDVMYRSQCTEGVPFNCTSDDACPNYVGQTINRAWQNSYYNFDNVGNGMLTLFVVATIDNPMDIIGYQTMDARGKDLSKFLNCASRQQRDLSIYDARDTTPFKASNTVCWRLCAFCYISVIAKC